MSESIAQFVQSQVKAVRSVSAVIKPGPIAVFRSILGMLATVVWCTAALVVRPFWKRSVIAWQPYWARTVLWCAGIDVKVKCPTPVKAPVVYVANHQSGLDILVMIAWMPDSVRFVAKKEMANAPFTGWCMRAADYVFIDRNNSEAAKESLKVAAGDIAHGGRSVIIFPEGHRYPAGSMGPWKTGCVHLAMAAGVPLVPVGIVNTGVLMERRSLIGRAGVVEINIGEPVQLDGWAGREKELREELRERVKGLAKHSAARDASEDERSSGTRRAVVN